MIFPDVFKKFKTGPKSKTAQLTEPKSETAQMCLVYCRLIWAVKLTEISTIFKIWFTVVVW